MKALVAFLLLLNGCSYMAEGKARCQAQFGPDASYNGIADRCVDLSRPAMMPMMMPFMMNEPAPSLRYTAPPFTPLPMPNRCTSTVIGSQISTTCF